jgi:hypothetical protein
MRYKNKILSMAKKQMGVVIYTYDRVDDAKINMEIIRGTWATQKSLKDIPIVHVFNGEPEWWPEKYLEDDLILVENRGHFAGCAHQMDVGIRYFQENYLSVTHLVVLAADTWILKPEYLVNVIKSMEKEEHFMASCGWGLPVQQTKIWNDAAVDFFIIDLKFATSSNMFPLNYSEYIEKYGEVFAVLNKPVLVEALLVLRFRQALLRYIGNPPPSDNLINWTVSQYIHLMKEREPVHNYQPHFERIMHYPALGMLGHHNPVPKQKALRDYDSTAFGKNTLRFLQSKNVSYFNDGVINWSFEKRSKAKI